MFIEAIDLYHVSLPLKRPWQTPLRTFSTLETVLVRMRSDGVSGWGEASPGNAPHASSEWAAGVMLALRDWLAPVLCGKAIDRGEEIEQHLGKFRGNRYAKGALDMAWWELSARLQNRPLHQLLGGTQQHIPLGVTFDQMESHEEFLAAIGQAFADGFSRVKLKFRPGWDVRMVDAVRKDYPDQTIHIDVEGGLNLSHMEMLCRLDDFMLAMIEQPLAEDDLVAHAMLQETIRTPVALDESITTVGQAEMALDLKSCRYVSLKPGRVGGLSSASIIHDLCQENHVECFLGAMPQTAIGARIGYALASKPNFTYPADYFPAEQYLAADLAEPLLPQRNPHSGKLEIKLWTTPGIGVEPDIEAIEKYALQKASV